LRAWGERDPEQVHWHLGTIAVRTGMQGKGIGGLLMQVYEARLDDSRELGYLETDRSENLRFYGKSGFAVSGELEVLGVNTWFMRRESA
jgi:GNAT superfamily N-acetyltransferase